MFNNPFQLSVIHNFRKYFEIHYTNYKRNIEENRARDRALQKTDSHHLDYQVSESQTLAAAFQPLQKSLYRDLIQTTSHLHSTTLCWWNNVKGLTKVRMDHI